MQMVAQPVMAQPVGMVQPAMTTLQVTVPPTSKAGDPVQVAGPDGTVFNVVIPPGLEPGQQFQVQLPAAPVVAVATAVSAA